MLILLAVRQFAFKSLKNPYQIIHQEWVNYCWLMHSAHIFSYIMAKQHFNYYHNKSLHYLYTVFISRGGVVESRRGYFCEYDFVSCWKHTNIYGTFLRASYFFAFWWNTNGAKISPHAKIYRSTCIFPNPTEKIVERGKIDTLKYTNMTAHCPALIQHLDKKWWH